MSLAALSKKSTLVILAYSPTGLGHLRVTNALYEGLPKDISPILLGAQDKTTGNLHRFVSAHPFFEMLFELAQRGWLQYVSTFFYEYLLHSRTKLLSQQLMTVLDERIVMPDTIVVVATHFGLAHQLAHIRETFEKKTNIKMFLFVQVTDDSPQPIWYITGSDMIFVPSVYTKTKLEKYAKTFRLPKVPVIVTPYPVSPLLCETLSPDQQHNKKEQVTAKSIAHTHIALPVSGAAVGLEVLKTLIESLHKRSDRFIFHVIAKKAEYTTDFLASLIDHPYVKLHVTTQDREIINIYESVYKDTTISLEVTKPSEQTFKSLLTTEKKGGPIMLFTHPVGQQEYDNIDFLHRHHLIPPPTVQTILWEKAEKQESLDTLFGKEVLRTAKTWRGLLLPNDAVAKTSFIFWCLQQGIFTEMMHYTPQQHTDDPHKDEVSDTGVTQFWRTVAHAIQNPL
jgi:hypothetical protein